MQLKRIEKTKPCLRITLIKPFEVALYHNEIQRRVKLVFIKDIVQLLDLGRKVFTQKACELSEIGLEHVCEVPLVNVGLMSLPLCVWVKLIA